jgi:sugar/nucleoside kinase (ribokinase family)
MCFDHIVPHRGEAHTAPGSALLCGAMAAARVGARVAVYTRMALADGPILDPLRQVGVTCALLPAAETTFMEVVHPTEDVDVREMRQLRSAGFFAAGEVRGLDARFVHLAGVTDQEFSLPFMTDLKAAGHSLSVDMQSFVRQVDAESRVISFKNVADKRRIVALMDRVKLDIVEARLLTGEGDMEAAARHFERWGCPETVITCADGVLARVGGQTFYERFSNTSVVGRTGRGDTTFAGYMAWRLEHAPAEALKFAAALVSIKMETPGPFAGSLDDVLERMKASHR